MARAKRRELDGYSERHHILPRSLGGANDPSNIVSLTFREHFIAHMLLIRMTTGQAQRKMRHALTMMARVREGRIVVSWQFEAARRAQRVAMQGNKQLLGYTPSAETRRKLSAAGRASPRPSLVGQRFGRLLVTAKREDRTSDREMLWLCKCDCGTEAVVRGKSLRAGVTKSCGCFRRELMGRPRGPMSAETREAISAAKRPKQN